MNINEFKQRTAQLMDTKPFWDMEIYAIIDCIKEWLIAQLDGIDISVIDIILAGSRCRGKERPSSDLDVILVYIGDEREDFIFNVLHKSPLTFDDIVVDVNPKQIVSGFDLSDIEAYLDDVERFLAAKPRSLNAF